MGCTAYPTLPILGAYTPCQNLNGTASISSDVASYVHTTGVDADSLLEPAIEGTRTVLDSVVKHKATVRRVILTSSFAGDSSSSGLGKKSQAQPTDNRQQALPSVL